VATGGSGPDLTRRSFPPAFRLRGTRDGGYSPSTFDQENDMSTICQICGKGTSSGSRIVRHGLAKKKGGIGLHTTGVTKRLFKANLQKVRVKVGSGVKTMTVCTSCIKAGKIAKA